MSKEVTMTFRVEPELRSAFAEATELEHRPAASVLRDFMRDYVARVHIKPTVQAITARERGRRREDVNFAFASVELEGFKVPEKFAAATQRFINGEIEFNDLAKALPKVQDGRIVE